MEQLASYLLINRTYRCSLLPWYSSVRLSNGTCCELLGTCPPIRIVMFDEGGTIDTVQFNHQQNLDVLIDEKKS